MGPQISFLRLPRPPRPWSAQTGWVRVPPEQSHEADPFVLPPSMCDLPPRDAERRLGLMIEYDRIREAPLSHLDYFTEWGGHTWTRMVRTGVADFLGGNLRDLRVLEIGARYGRLSCMFGLLGARVVGVDIHAHYIEAAREEACKLGVTSRVEFVLSGGDLCDLPSQSYDLVFSKSVLVLLPDLEKTLSEVDRLLGSGGRIVFIENGLGGWLAQFMRRMRHRGRWDYSRVNYFTPEHIRTVDAVFEIERLVRSHFPPIYLICGRKRGSGGVLR